MENLWCSFQDFEVDWPLQSIEIAQILDASVSFLMIVRHIIKSFAVAELIFQHLHYCMDFLSEDTFLTSCPYYFYWESILITVRLLWVLGVILCCTVNSDDDCQLTPSVYKVTCPLCIYSLYLVVGQVVLCLNMVYTSLILNSSVGQAISSNHQSSIKQFPLSKETSVTCL